MNGGKRHLLTDTLGLLLGVLVTPASTTDRDAARILLSAAKGRFRRLSRVWADGGYTGHLTDWTTQLRFQFLHQHRRSPVDPAPVPTRHRSCPSRTGAGGPAGRLRSRTDGRDSHTHGWTNWTRRPRPRDTSTTGPLASRWIRQPRATKRPFFHASAPADSPEPGPCSTPTDHTDG
ncbi:transposase [Streptomyces sp. 6-11-2]|uniref:transposase n=1 Tax=Streptomyces sp. 6-11-2 TaxID=2585753 RepID=UPI00280AA813|nr:transposase [Streptomyces sp. 6-11-2]